VDSSIVKKGSSKYGDTLRVFKWYWIIFVNFISYIKVPQISTKSRSHLQTLEATRVTRYTLHAQDSEFKCELWSFLLSGAFCSFNKNLHLYVKNTYFAENIRFYRIKFGA
jgi:hypothetical protein